MTTACAGLDTCDACAVAMAQIYQNYEADLNDMYSKMFADYENKMFSNLEAENKKVQVQAAATTSTIGTSSL